MPTTTPRATKQAADAVELAWHAYLAADAATRIQAAQALLDAVQARYPEEQGFSKEGNAIAAFFLIARAPDRIAQRAQDSRQA